MAFVELNRTFYELKETAEQDSLGGFETHLGKQLGWDQLLLEDRVVILCEAGTGKTAEIRNKAGKLKRDGKVAFFLRLENLVDNFELAFEDEFGSFCDFEAWKTTSTAAYFFLDSIDEAKLKSHRDFELAIKKLHDELRGIKQTFKLFITGRPHAWLHKSDKDLCERFFAKPKTTSDLSNREPPNSTSFRFFVLDDLNAEQIQTFVDAKQIRNRIDFFRAITKLEADLFTARPLDLEALVEYWNSNGAIGSYFELIESGIDRRLTELDQKRAFVDPLPKEKIRMAARLVAAASTLTREANILVPDGIQKFQGLSVKDLLDDWTDNHCNALLSRSVFDPAIYGAVKFHHRTMREFLAASWFAELLESNTSRVQIEKLFFRESYGLKVVVPHLRPVLPWLAIQNTNILNLTISNDPTILLEGGDASRFPLGVREQILTAVCAALDKRSINQRRQYLRALGQLGGLELKETITELAIKYRSNSEVVEMLLQLVRIGKIVDLLPIAIAAAINAGLEPIARAAAIRTVKEIGISANLAQIRSTFLKDIGSHDLRLCALLIKASEQSADATKFALRVAKEASEAGTSEHFFVVESLNAYCENASIACVSELVNRFYELLALAPFCDERTTPISKEYRHLISPAIEAVRRLFSFPGPIAISPQLVGILRLIPFSNFDSFDVQENDKVFLQGSIDSRQTLKFSLFWHIVEQTKSLTPLDGRPIWQLVNSYLYNSFVKFVPADFNMLITGIENRQLACEKEIALFQAFNLFETGGRQADQLLELQNAALISIDLTQFLFDRLAQPSMIEEREEILKWESESAVKRKFQTDKQQRAQDEFKSGLMGKLDVLRNPTSHESTGVWHDRSQLLDEIRKQQGDRFVYSAADWRLIEPKYGSEISCAFRDGAISYWRLFQPKLPSEGGSVNVSVGENFGLLGLNIEAGEIASWQTHLTEIEADCAFRYSRRELNGFPFWFSKLTDEFPEVIGRLALAEVQHELQNDDDIRLLITDISHSPNIFWHTLAPSLVEVLKCHEPRNLNILISFLDVVQAALGDVSDDALAKLAEAKVSSGVPDLHLPDWYAVWIGAQPVSAIPFLENHLDSIENFEKKSNFAMLVATALTGGKLRRVSRVRRGYLNATCLSKLYSLITKCVPYEKDNLRTNKGPYSPELRDDAQDSREQLIQALVKIPGKAAFAVISELSANHPNERYRDWLQMKAIERAEFDSDGEAWSTKQVVDFSKKLDRVPKNHSELFDLAVMRLEDLKSDLEGGDTSDAKTLEGKPEDVIRNYIANYLRHTARGRYSIPQEEQIRKAKRPDLRFHGSCFDGPVPVELKIADNWTGSELFERLENQLCRDYLSDKNSRCGIFLVLYDQRDLKRNWKVPLSKKAVPFGDLVRALQDHWAMISAKFPDIDAIKVIGLDLS